MAFNRHPEGRQPIGVAQQPFPCYDYPLVPPISSDINYLLADLKLVYEDPGLYESPQVPFKLPFRISYLRGLGEVTTGPISNPPPPAKCIIVDADGSVVIDTEEASLHRYSLANRMMVYVWRKSRNTLYLVAHTHWSTEGEFPPPQEYGYEITPTRAVLDPRTCICVPRVVRSISALDLTGVAGGFEFISGYNYLIDVSQATEELRQQNQLIMNAIPGAGAGVFQDCEQKSPAIHSLGGVKPTKDGKFFISADDCTWVRQPILEVEGVRQLRPFSLQVGDNCKPCCDCADYARTAIEMYRLQQKYKAIGNSLHNTRNQYHTALNRWKSRKALKMNYSLDLKLLAQYCPQLDVVAQFNNATSQPVYGAELELTFESTGVITTPPTLVGTYAQMFVRQTPEQPQQYMPAAFEISTWPKYIITLTYVGAQESAHVRFRLEFSDCTPRLITASLVGSVEGFGVEDKDGNPVTLTQSAGICGYEAPEE